MTSQYAMKTTKSEPNFMTEEEARDFAWKKLCEDLGTEGWTVLDSINFHGFFMWGWRYRAQYDRQRAATSDANA